MMAEPPPEKMQGDQYQWFWDWNAATQKDPAFGQMWRGYFTNATGVNPMDVNLQTPQDALLWQQKRHQGQGMPAQPESRNVQDWRGGEPLSTPAGISWMQQNLRYRFQGRIKYSPEWGLYPADPYDQEVLRHLREGR